MNEQFFRMIFWSVAFFSIINTFANFHASITLPSFQERLAILRIRLLPALGRLESADWRCRLALELIF